MRKYEYGGYRMHNSVSGNFDVKSTEFNDVASYSKNDVDDMKKKKFDQYPGGVFTMPNPNAVAYNQGKIGGDEGGFQA